MVTELSQNGKAFGVEVRVDGQARLVALVVPCRP